MLKPWKMWCLYFEKKLNEENRHLKKENDGLKLAAANENKTPP